MGRLRWPEAPISQQRHDLVGAAQQLLRALGALGPVLRELRGFGAGTRLPRKPLGSKAELQQGVRPTGGLNELEVD